MHNILITLAVLASASIQSPERTNDAVRDHVQEVIAWQKKHGFSSWAGHDSPVEIPGGYLMKFEIDVVGDPAPELFVRSTLGEVVWSVYQIQQNKGYALVTHDLRGSPADFLMRRDGSKTIFSTVYLKPDLILLGRTIFFRDGRVERQSKKFEGESARKLQTEDAYLTEFQMGNIYRPTDMQMVTLAEFLRDSNPVWRPYDFNHSPSYQATAPTEALMVAKMPKLWPSEAETLLREALEHARFVSPRAATQNSPPATASAPDSAPTISRSATNKYSRPLWLWFFGIAALVMIGLIVWKRRP